MGRNRIFKRIIFTFFIITAVWFLVHTLIITIHGLSDQLAVTDAAVVLGNKVEANGRPSKRLQGRLDKAAELYGEGYCDYIIVSGALGKEGFDEAVVMKGYLVDHGIPEEYIITDQNGVDTYATAQDTKKIMDQMGFDSLTIVTQFYHISRTALAFDKVGIINVSSAHADYFELRDIYSLSREFFAYYKYLLI